MWESGVCCGISKRGGSGGKVGVGLFHGFHRASIAGRANFAPSSALVTVAEEGDVSLASLGRYTRGSETGRRSWGWPGYRRGLSCQEINEQAKTLKLLGATEIGQPEAGVFRVCGQRVPRICTRSTNREIRLICPCFEFQTTVVIELYRVDCPGLPE